MTHLGETELSVMESPTAARSDSVRAGAVSAQRIVMIQPWIRLGGAELVSLHLAHELNRLGRQAVIVCAFVDLKGLPDWAERLHYLVPPRWLAGRMQKSRVLFLLLSPWVLLWLVWKHSKGASILNPHNFPATWVATAVAFLRRIPVVWFCNEPPTRVPARDALRVGLPDYVGWLLASSWIDRLVVRRVADVCVPSTMTRFQAEERYRRPAKVQYVGVDAEFFRSSDGSSPRAELGLDGKYVLLCVGKLHPQKNQVICLEALREVVEQIPNAILVLAGDGPSAAQLKLLSEEWGLQDRVRFMGHVEAKTARRLYQACDLNLVPAVNQSWGFTAFEALCAGKVSIVSDSAGGAAEILGEHSIGVVCTPSGQAFARAILDLYHDRPKYREFSSRGQAHILRELTWRAFARRMLDVFDAQAC
jgi:glycosyltransferase involved in cell wall biosynthesis